MTFVLDRQRPARREQLREQAAAAAGRELVRDRIRREREQARPGWQRPKTTDGYSFTNSRGEPARLLSYYHGDLPGRSW